MEFQETHRKILKLCADEIIKFIEQEWNFLGKTPTIGHVLV